MIEAFAFGFLRGFSKNETNSKLSYVNIKRSKMCESAIKIWIFFIQYSKAMCYKIEILNFSMQHRTSYSTMARSRKSSNKEIFDKLLYNFSPNECECLFGTCLLPRIHHSYVRKEEHHKWMPWTSLEDAENASFIHAATSLHSDDEKISIKLL
jgi:hypothetical protein